MIRTRHAHLPDDLEDELNELDSSPIRVGDVTIIHCHDALFLLQDSTFGHECPRRPARP